MKGNKMKLLGMCTWPELHTCILCMKRKSIKENKTRVNTFLNQFTYKLQKEKQNKTNLLDFLTWKGEKKKHTGEAFEN